MTQFAKRTNWFLEPNPLSRTLERLKARGTTIFDLTVSNPTLCDIPVDKELILNALGHNDNIFYRPSAHGAEPARLAVCDYYRRKGIEVQPEQVFLTASTSEAYAFLFRLLADPDDHILFPRPSYPLFNFLADLNDVVSDYYRLAYKGRWEMDPESIQAQLTPKVKGVVLVHPNNPTGSFVSEREREGLTKISKDLPLIVDEVFLDYPFDAARAGRSFAGRTEGLTFTMGGLSKTLGLPQMKLSWIVISGPSSEVKAAAERLEVITDTFLSVNTPVQNATPEWMARGEKFKGAVLQRVGQNRAFLQTAVSTHSHAKLLSADGGWYAILECPGAAEEEEFALRLLEEDRVFVHPGFFFDFPDNERARVVLSLLPAPDIFTDGVTKLLRRIKP
jgi:alanine-synthesizing transaminase